MISYLKKSLFDTYEDMDLDLPNAPEDTKDLAKFKETKAFRERRVNIETLEAWVKKWPGQSTFLCS